VLVDTGLLKEFEKGLDPEHPEKSKIPARVLGYGEISTIFEIDSPTTAGLACKRLPIFQTGDEVESYERLYNLYNTVLADKIGIQVPAYGFAWFSGDKGRVTAFVLQQKLYADSIGNRAIHVLNTDNIRTLFLLILRQLNKLWEFNRANPESALGIDGQISNWAISNLDAANPVLGQDTTLIYFDTSTPLMKKGGAEQLNPELFLRSAPSFLVWLIRWLFLKDVMTRYYDERLVTIDLIANFYKEQRQELIPMLVEAANKFYGTASDGLEIEPITEKEIKSYYEEDKVIWTLFLAFRRFDRWLHKYILHRSYRYILPGPIKR
jgi:hypothetical protein